MDPGELLVGVGVRGRLDRGGVLEAAEEDMGLRRPTYALIGDRRAALPAEAALDPGGGAVDRGLAGGDLEALAIEARICREGGGSGAPAALAMAMGHPD